MWQASGGVLLLTGAAYGYVNGDSLMSYINSVRQT